MESSAVKQVILVRKDLGMRKGKMIAQGAHAGAAFLLDLATAGLILTPVERRWAKEGHTRICLGVSSEGELLTICRRAGEEAALRVRIIFDEGLTEVPAGTPTAAAIGPDYCDKIDLFTRHLPLL